MLQVHTSGNRNGLILLNVKQLRSLLVTDKAELAVSAEFFIHLEGVSLSVFGEDAKGLAGFLEEVSLSVQISKAELAFLHKMRCSKD